MAKLSFDANSPLKNVTFINPGIVKVYKKWLIASVSINMILLGIIIYKVIN